MQAYRSAGKSIAVAMVAALCVMLGGFFSAATTADAQSVPRRIRRAPGVPPPGSQSYPPAGAMQQPMNPMPGPQAPHATQDSSESPGPAPSGDGLQDAEERTTVTSSLDDQSPASTPALPPSLLDQPAQPAKMELNGNMLSIQAENASLNTLLQAIAGKTGMAIEGLGEDQRVFGNFGPATPHDVLQNLLNGSAYDVLMVGALENGAPRQLILSRSNKSSSQTLDAPLPPPSRSFQKPEAADSGVEPPPSPPPPQNRKIKSPQELFRELQAMQESQQQQNEEPVNEEQQ